MLKPDYICCSLVPRRSRFGQSWTIPWAVTSPRDKRRELSPALPQTSRGQRGKRERLGTRLHLLIASFLVWSITLPYGTYSSVLKTAQFLVRCNLWISFEKGTITSEIKKPCSNIRITNSDIDKDNRDNAYLQWTSIWDIDTKDSDILSLLFLERLLALLILLRLCIAAPLACHNLFLRFFMPALSRYTLDSK